MRRPQRQELAAQLMRMLTASHHAWTCGSSWPVKADGESKSRSGGVAWLSLHMSVHMAQLLPVSGRPRTTHRFWRNRGHFVRLYNDGPRNLNTKRNISTLSSRPIALNIASKSVYDLCAVGTESPCHFSKELSTEQHETSTDAARQWQHCICTFLKPKKAGQSVSLVGYPRRYMFDPHRSSHCD